MMFNFRGDTEQGVTENTTLTAQNFALTEAERPTLKKLHSKVISDIGFGASRET
jgi:hypothetical protein